MHTELEERQKALDTVNADKLPYRGRNAYFSQMRSYLTSYLADTSKTKARQNFVRMMNYINVHNDELSKDLRKTRNRMVEDIYSQYKKTKSGELYTLLVEVFPYTSPNFMGKYKFLLKWRGEKELLADLTKHDLNPGKSDRIAKTYVSRGIKRKLRPIRGKIEKIKLFFMEMKGFSPFMAKYWLDSKKKDLANKSDGVPTSVKKWAHRHGFLSYRIEQYGITKDNYKGFISDRDYMWINPINEKFRRLINDKMTTRYVLDPFSEYLPDYYYLIMKRGTQKSRILMPLQDLPEGYKGYSYRELLRLLREKGDLALKPSSGTHGDGFYRLSYKNEQYYINMKPVNQEDIIDRIATLHSYYVVTEYIQMHAQLKEIYPDAVCTVRVIVFNENGSEPTIAETYIRIGSSSTGVVDNLGAGGMMAHLDKETGHYGNAKAIVNQHILDCPNHPDTGTLIEGVLPNWDKVKKQVKEIMIRMPELEYIGFDVAITEDGFKIIEMNTYPDFPRIKKIDQELTNYLKEVAAAKRKHNSVVQNYKAFKKRVTDSRVAKKTDYMGYMYQLWKRDLKDDTYHNTYATKEEIKWAHDRGFLSYRIKQYGLTEENYMSYLSDRDYRYLRPINNSYRKWIYDKVTMRYVLNKYKEYIPEYYYHIVPRTHGMFCVCMQDCPEGFGAGFDELVRLLKTKGLLAMKPTEGSHGVGFYKLEYKDGTYYVNEEAMTESQITAFFEGLDDYYNVSEYIQMHDAIKAIYPNVVCTIRAMVINKDTKSPKLMNTYIRIGTNSTGMTDNIAFGGVFAQIDKDTGHLHTGEKLENHVIVPCPNHPDTGAALEGYLPNWDIVKEKIVEISKYIGQLEYMGFDIVITPNAFKILEINTHQDLHRYPNYGPEVNEYFRDKLFEKGARYCSRIDTPQVSIGLNNHDGRPELKWNPIKDAYLYEIYRATKEDSNYRCIFTTDKPHFKNVSAVPGVTYYYKVKALCAKGIFGDSEMSKYRYVTCDCATPKVKISLNSKGSPTLSWEDVDGASRYAIYRSNDGENFRCLNTTQKKMWSDSSAEAGKTYYYKVEACCGRNKYGNSKHSDAAKIQL